MWKENKLKIYIICAALIMKIYAEYEEKGLRKPWYSAFSEFTFLIKIKDKN